MPRAMSITLVFALLAQTAHGWGFNTPAMPPSPPNPPPPASPSPSPSPPPPPPPAVPPEPHPPPVGYHKNFFGGWWESPSPPPPSPPVPSTPPPPPPPPPTAPPPPANPGTLHWGRLLIPLVLFAGLVYLLPLVLPHKYPPDVVDNLDFEVDDARALLAEARKGFTAVLTELPTSELVDVDKVRELADVGALKTSSLVEWSTVSSFLITLAAPLDHELYTKKSLAPWLSSLQSLESGFELLNACGFWLEVLSVYIGFVFGYASAYGLFDGLYVGAPGFFLYLFLLLELLVALAVGYLLFWCVRLAQKPSYTLAATCVYFLVGFANLFYGLFCLLGGFEPLRFLVYLLKTLVALGCAFYAFKTREKRLKPSARTTAPSPPFGGGEQEDYVVVTAMDQPTPSFPGVPAPKKGPTPATTADGDELTML